jgi:hypothetical protein
LDQIESRAHNAWPTQRSIARCVEIFIVAKLSHPAQRRPLFNGYA